MKNMVHRSLVVLLALFAAVFLAAEAEACVTCENSECKAIQGDGALNCVSINWIFGSHCSLSGHCKGSSPKLQKTDDDPGVSTAACPGPGVTERSLHGLFGTRIEKHRVLVVRKTGALSPESQHA